MYSVLTWLVGKVLFVGISIHHFALQNHSTQKERLFSFSPCSVFLVMVLSATHALSSQGAMVLYRHVFSSGTVMTFICGFRDARRHWLQLKNSRSVKENTSQWESEVLSASHIFQWFVVFYTPLMEAAISFIFGFAKDRTRLTLHTSNCAEDFMSLLSTHTQSPQLWF